jgi:cytochrome P450
MLKKFEISLKFQFAGQETTASTLSWIIFHLGKFQEIQEKVRAEVNAVLGNKKKIHQKKNFKKKQKGKEKSQNFQTSKNSLT